MKKYSILRWTIFFFCAIGMIYPFAVHAQKIDIDTSSPFLAPQYSKRISMDFQDASLVDVLKIFSKQSGMNLVTSQEIAAKRVTVYLDNVPVEQALEQVLRANNLVYELQPDTDIYLVKPLVRPENELITRVYSLKHASVSSAKINNTLTLTAMAQSAQNVGITQVIGEILTANGKIVEDPRTNSLIVTDIATNFPQIEQTIARLDVPLPQILIEVEMLEVAKSTSDQLGIKYGNEPLSFTGGTRSHLYPWDQNTILREAKFTFTEEYTAGVIDATGFTAALNFLRSQTDTKNLARPRIITLNNQPAQISIKTDEAIGIKTTTASAENIATSNVEADRTETGVFLTVTPQANILTGEITMALDPRVIIARTGGTFSGQTFKDPEERGSQSLLRVRSGDTIIMAGLMREDITKTVTKVPFLGDIPFIGGAFRHKDETSTERELIIFITPHILQESPLPETPLAKNQKIIREQDILTPRNEEIQKELSWAEKQ